MAGGIASADHGPPAQVDSKSEGPVSRHGSWQQAPDGGVIVVAEVDAATERRLVRKLDRRLVLLAFLCYMAAFLDRSNIGNAETAGMSKDLGFDNAQYQWLLTIFYIPYILFEWFALMWKICPPHIWAFVTVLTWAIASMLQASAFNWEGLMACRFFLATAEAGFGPGIPYLFSFFYTRRELGFRCGIFLSAAPLATTFAGALAYGITGGHYSSSTIASWRLLFIIEAIPPLILAFAVLFYLPDSAASARFLTDEEKAIARARALNYSGHHEGGTAQGHRLGSINPRDILGAIKTPQAWVMALMFFSCNVAFASLPVFLPAILEGMGFTSVNAQGLTAPPYFLAFVVCIASTYAGDRTQQRGLLITGLSLVGCAGYVMLAASRSVGVRYAGVFLAAAGVFPAIANILSWTLNNQRGDTRRGVGIALMNIVGQCGPLLGTRVFPAREGPYYVKGMSVCAAFMAFNAVLAFSLRTYFKVRNDRWDKVAREPPVTADKPGGYEQFPDITSHKHLEMAAGAGMSQGLENSAEWRFAL
ncbi:hypothetical protein DHEL01_v212449 [Diaporthe helianthi]|uniref:Major facilitator superfamily (MFS) profile domain-containing protein n=1 Tax=Diaporthe helianthi TaxID=158607 RepID=A0A2P5HFY2_DIAHE|nr:hypothetical protein DHEL01_v212449 [Diaporthe helianthi]